MVPSLRIFVRSSWVPRATHIGGAHAGRMWMYGTAWWMWLLMGVGMIGFWVLVAATVKAVLDDRGPETSATPDLTRVLDERLARGEIDAEEYLRLQRLIQQGPRADQPIPRDHPAEP